MSDDDITTTSSAGAGDRPRWIAAQLDGLVWRPVAAALLLGGIGILLEAISALVGLDGLQGIGGSGFVAVPVAIVVSLVITSYRPSWPAMRRRAIVRIARGITVSAAIVSAALATFAGFLFACSGGFLCGDDPVAAAGLFTLAGALLGAASWSAVARGRWWLHILVGTALGLLPGAFL